MTLQKQYYVTAHFIFIILLAGSCYGAWYTSSSRVSDFHNPHCYLVQTALIHWATWNPTQATQGTKCEGFEMHNNHYHAPITDLLTCNDWQYKPRCLVGWQCLAFVCCLLLHGHFCGLGTHDPNPGQRHCGFDQLSALAATCISC